MFHISFNFEGRPHFGKFIFDTHIISFIKYWKSKTTFKSSLNSHDYWDTLYILGKLKMKLSERTGIKYSLYNDSMLLIQCLGKSYIG